MIVSVPYGELFYFYKKYNTDYYIPKWLFPSPMGIFFISISIHKVIYEIVFNVSVPYGDLFYFYLQQYHSIHQ